MTPLPPVSARASTSADPSSSDSPLEAILDRQRAAANREGIPTAGDRIAHLTRLERALVRHQDAITDAICADFGHRSRHETRMVDVYALLASIRHTRANLGEWMEDEPRQTSWLFVPGRARVVRQPLGVVGILSPWNYPFQLAVGPLVAALGAGNRVMMKPSEHVPRASDVLSRLVADTFDVDHVTVVQGGADVAETFSRLRFDHLVFTGSQRVGKLVMRTASDNLVPVTLELGGKCPAIVSPSFDARVAASRIMFGKTFSAGQTCIAPDYALVPHESCDAFVEGCRAAVSRMYPTLASNVDYTAIVDDSQFRRIRGFLDDAAARGATVVELNPAAEVLSAENRKIAPTLILGATGEMLCLKEEIFGPVLPIVTHRGLSEAIAYVNDRPRPLALYFFGHSAAEMDMVLSRTVSGGVTFNDTLLHFIQDDLPFGGIGQSGMGQYHGRDGFDRLTHRKAVFHQAPLNTTGMLRPPFGKPLDALLRLLIGR
jgi:coniferyl-aldehyde dehydrogenase